MSLTPSTLDYAADLLRSHSIDFYFWSLFIPAEHRGAVQTLLAFEIEIARIPSQVSEVSLGEIRYQWWRDSVSALSSGEESGYPVIDVLGAVTRRYSLPLQPLIALIDAHVMDLYDDQLADLSMLEGYIGETYGTLIRLISLILADGRPTGDAALAGHAAVAIGIQKIFEQRASDLSNRQKFVPLSLLRGDVTGIPQEISNFGGTEQMDAASRLQKISLYHLEIVKKAWRGIPDYVKPAFLSLSITKRVMRRSGKQPNLKVPTFEKLSPLRNLSALWLGYLKRSI